MDMHGMCDEKTMGKVQSPSVSIIVPVYNIEKYVSCCIDSILAQTFSKHSIASEAFCMNQVTFALQNIKIRLWQAVKILKGYWNFITRSPRQAVFR